MMGDFLKRLTTNYQFHTDKCYLWISFGGDDSYRQSKDKLWHYFNGGTDMSLKDIGNLNEEKLYPNNIFFINWSKIKGTNKESKKLRRETEHTQGDKGIFDEYIERTKEEREIILIIDEAHTETSTTLAEEVIELIDPKIILKVTATPKDEEHIKSLAYDDKAGFVEVTEKEVIESGLIKERLVIQTEDEIKQIQQENSSLNEDEMMLELAFNKRLELKKIYEDLGLRINPLVLIQLPSDERENKNIERENKKDIVTSFLKDKGVKEHEIAIWLSKEKKNLDEITHNHNHVDFMIFKVAPATGWDCPRADILVMFREISNPSFHTQIIGRIKRMPEGKHYNKTELNSAYIYTNYNKQHIRDIKELVSGNKPPLYFTKLKDSISQIQLKTTFHHRTEFNSLRASLWQKSCFKTFHEYFGTSSEGGILNHENYNILKEKINLENRVIDNAIIVNAEIESFDNFINDLKKEAGEVNYSLSINDIEKLYNLLCFNELKQQEKEEAKYNPSRSWSALKSAINVYFIEHIGGGLKREEYYKIIVNELLENNSKLKKVIHKALIDFRKEYERSLKNKKDKDTFELSLPLKEISYTDDFEEIDLKNESRETYITKNVYEKFYLKKKYTGRENELKFIKFLENQNIDWWHKQNDSGRDCFAIEYRDSQENKKRLFYPDFIVKRGNEIYIY